MRNLDVDKFNHEFLPAGEMVRRFYPTDKFKQILHLYNPKFYKQMTKTNWPVTFLRGNNRDKVSKITIGPDNWPVTQTVNEGTHSDLTLVIWRRETDHRIFFSFYLVV